MMFSTRSSSRAYIIKAVQQWEVVLEALLVLEARDGLFAFGFLPWTVVHIVLYTDCINVKDWNLSSTVRKYYCCSFVYFGDPLCFLWPTFNDLAWNLALSLQMFLGSFKMKLQSGFLLTDEGWTFCTAETRSSSVRIMTLTVLEQTITSHCIKAGFGGTKNSR